MKNILNDIEAILNNYNKIGILASGGLDSSLLAYLLHDIKYKTNRNNSFEFFVVPRPDDSLTHVKRIVKYLDEYFKQSPSTINIVGNGDLHHSKQVASGADDAIDNYNCEIYLSATTANPTEPLPNYEYGSFLEPDGTPYNGPVRKQSYNPKLLHVFWDYTKEDTVSIIKQYKLHDIVRLSHTCTGSRLKRCNKCWQCCERAWAFSKNNYTDIGEM